MTWEFRSLILFLFLLLFGEGISQQVNPFDVRNRSNISISTHEVKEVIPENVTLPVQDELNPLDHPEEAPQENEEFTNKPVETDQIEQQEENNELSFLEKRQHLLISENPFNVSRIPLRRTTPKEKKAIKKAPTEIPQTVDPLEQATTKKISKADETDNTSSKKFIFWLLLFQFLLVASLLSINREFIGKIARSITNDNFAKLVSRDNNGGYNGSFGILYVLFIISFSIFIYQAASYFFDINGFFNFTIISLGVIAVYLFRHIFQNFSAAIFPFHKPSKYFDFTIILFNSLLGLVLIPVNLIVAYSPVIISEITIYFGLGTVVLFYLVRFLRGTLHAYSLVRKYQFHFFLYLCTCEFAPVFILVKFLSKSFLQ